jgi:hypothetical protein
MKPIRQEFGTYFHKHGDLEPAPNGRCFRQSLYLRFREGRYGIKKKACRALIDYDAIFHCVVLLPGRVRGNYHQWVLLY